MPLPAHLVDGLQLRLGVQGAQLSGLGEVDQAGLDRVLVAGVGPVGGTQLGDLLGGDLPVFAGEGQHLVPGGLHRPRLVGVDMAGVGTDHPLIGL